MDTSPKGTACITGGSSGIGAAFARRLAAEGYSLVIHGRRENLLAELCTDLRRRHGIRAEFMTGDLAQHDDLVRLEKFVRSIADLAMLINNAGTSTVRMFHDEPVESQESLIRLHVFAMVRLSHAAIHCMLSRGGGAIINVASVAGLMVSPGSATYCATKGYMISFSESLHLELRERGIRVQALCPGFTTTDFHSRIGMKITPSLRRHFMNPDTVVDASMRALQRGTVVCIPGWRYKISALLPRVLPRRGWYAIVRTFSRRSRELRGTLGQSAATREN